MYLLDLANVGKRCYSHNGERIGFYDSSFVSGLRLSLNYLAKMLVRRLSIEVSQLTPNAWRTFVGAQLSWGIMSDGSESLTLDEFLFFYQSLSSPLARGFIISKNVLQINLV